MVGRGGDVSWRAPTERRVYLVAVRCGAYLQYISCGAVLGAVAVAAAIAVAAIAADRSGVVPLAPKLCHWVGRGTTSLYSYIGVRRPARGISGSSAVVRGTGATQHRPIRAFGDFVVRARVSQS